MSEKILSVIIPTYNMEKLLPRCLDSLLATPFFKDLNILVVNDGSKDNSLDVAQDYAKKNPDVITVIDKPNGNYGSTINAALPVAIGRYVKVLDSDDWFDSKALTDFISALKNLETDVVITPFTELGANGKKEVVRYNTMGREPYAYGKVYDTEKILSDGYIRFFLMHGLTYRTELLREMNYRQTEGISYTDTEWSCFPIYFIKTIAFLDINLYQYNLDRDGQTMNPLVLAKSANQMEKVNDSLITFYEENFKNLSVAKQKFMKQYMENRIRLQYKLYLLDMPREIFSEETFRAVEQKYATVCKKFDWHFRLYPENKLVRVDYVKYWRKHQKRWPRWAEWCNKKIDVVVRYLYVKFFRR